MGTTEVRPQRQGVDEKAVLREVARILSDTGARMFWLLDGSAADPDLTVTARLCLNAAAHDVNVAVEALKRRRP